MEFYPFSKQKCHIVIGLSIDVEEFIDLNPVKIVQPDSMIVQSYNVFADGFIKRVRKCLFVS